MYMNTISPYVNLESMIASLTPKQCCMIKYNTFPPVALFDNDRTSSWKHITYNNNKNNNINNKNNNKIKKQLIVSKAFYQYPFLEPCPHYFSSHVLSFSAHVVIKQLYMIATPASLLLMIWNNIKIWRCLSRSNALSNPVPLLHACLIYLY